VRHILRRLHRVLFYVTSALMSFFPSSLACNFELGKNELIFLIFRLIKCSELNFSFFSGLNSVSSEREWWIYDNGEDYVTQSSGYKISYINAPNDWRKLFSTKTIFSRFIYTIIKLFFFLNLSLFRLCKFTNLEYVWKLVMLLNLWKVSVYLKKLQEFVFKIWAPLNIRQLAKALNAFDGKAKKRSWKLLLTVSFCIHIHIHSSIHHDNQRGNDSLL